MSSNVDIGCCSARFRGCNVGMAGLTAGHSFKAGQDRTGRGDLEKDVKSP